MRTIDIEVCQNCESCTHFNTSNKLNILQSTRYQQYQNTNTNMRASVISEHKHKYEGIRNNRTQERL